MFLSFAVYPSIFARNINYSTIWGWGDPKGGNIFLFFLHSTRLLYSTIFTEKRRNSFIIGTDMKYIRILGFGYGHKWGHHVSIFYRLLNIHLLASRLMSKIFVEIAIYHLFKNRGMGLPLKG